MIIKVGKAPGVYHVRRIITVTEEIGDDGKAKRRTRIKPYTIELTLGALSVLQAIRSFETVAAAFECENGERWNIHLEVDHSIKNYDDAHQNSMVVFQEIGGSRFFHLIQEQIEALR